MIPVPNPENEISKKYPELYVSMKEEIEVYNSCMASELKVVSLLIVGAWLGVLLVSEFAEFQSPPSVKSRYAMLAISLSYYGLRKLRWWLKKRELKRRLAAQISFRENTQMMGGIPW